jgi:DNA polymerase-4
LTFAGAKPDSLDEAYLDVTENIQGIPIATEIATMIRAKILSETGLTAFAERVARW